MTYRELVPGRHQQQLPLNVPEMLKLADVNAQYVGSGRWSLARGGAVLTSDPFPNYDDFVLYVQRLMQWKCSDMPKQFFPFSSRRR